MTTHRETIHAILRLISTVRRYRIETWGSLIVGSLMEAVLEGEMMKKPWDLTSLAQLMGVSRQTVGRHVSALEERGLVRAVVKGHRTLILPTARAQRMLLGPALDEVVRSLAMTCSSLGEEIK